MRVLICASMFLGFVGSSLAADGAIPLPASAKKLSAAEFMVLEGGKTFNYTSYGHDPAWQGETSFDWGKKKFWGTYPDKGKPTKYPPDSLGLSGDTFCYGKCPGPGLSVYLDGATIYEVNPDGKVHEVLNPK